MRTLLSNKSLLDVVIGWQGAAPGTRARLLEAFCTGIRPGTLVSNSITALIVGAFVVARTGNPTHVVWLLCALLGGLLPRAYAARLRRRGDYSRFPERKALTFVAISAVYGLIWGAGPLLMLPDLTGTAVGIFLLIIIFGTIMGPYAAMPGILYARLVATGVPTLIAIALYTTPELAFVSSVLAVWLVLRTDVWRGYHQSLRREMELREALEARQDELRRANLATQQVNDDLKVLAETDPLTGIANRRQFVRELESVSGPAAVILFDIDRFKPINDRFGHQAGDAVLVELVRLAQEALRRQDLLARLGGDEFAIVLPGLTSAEAWTVAERIRDSVARHRVQSRGHALRFTISLGVASVAEHAPAADVEALLHRADGLLYAAKRQGRNQICSEGETQDSRLCEA